MTPLNLTWVDLFTWLFLVANAGRVLAYVPQIAAAWKCQSGAKSVSLLTWSYFTFAHLTALTYALVVLQDAKSAWVFAGNLCFTGFLVVLLVFKRLQHRHRIPAPGSVDMRKAKLEARKAVTRAQSFARANAAMLRRSKGLAPQITSSQSKT